MSNGTKITLGHPEAHEKLTGRLFWKRTGDTGYNDAGNVLDYVDTTSRALVTRNRTQQGARHVNNEQADVCHEAYTFLLDERVPAQEELISLARQLNDKVQDAAEGVTATIQGVQPGKWFMTGAYNLANVRVTGSASGAREEGSDYQVDKENGRIYVEAASGIAAGETLNVLFDEPGIAFEKRESQFSPLFYCDVIVEEHNQYSRMFLRRKTFRAYMNVTAWPSQTGAFGQYRVKLTAAGPVIEEKRPEGQTLPVHGETGSPGESSSSSASSRSSKSSASSHSSYSSQSLSSASSKSSQSSASSYSSHSLSSLSSVSSLSSYSSHSFSSLSSPSSQSSASSQSSGSSYSSQSSSSVSSVNSSSSSVSQ